MIYEYKNELHCFMFRNGNGCADGDLTNAFSAYYSMIAKHGDVYDS